MQISSMQARCCIWSWVFVTVPVGVPGHLVWGCSADRASRHELKQPPSRGYMVTVAHGSRGFMVIVAHGSRGFMVTVAHGSRG